MFAIFNKQIAIAIAIAVFVTLLMTITFTMTGYTSNPIMTTCTVTTTGDSGPGSLRECLLDATVGTTIGFDSQTFSSTMPVTITLSLSLPSLITDSLTIDASNAGVVLDGSGLSKGAGLVIDGADGVMILGLQVLNFPQSGIKLTGGASNALIGGEHSLGSAPLGQGNLISNNGDAGVRLEGPETTGNQLRGNYVGTDVSGTFAFGNMDGLVIADGANGNLIGGESADTGNLISGNSHHGIFIEGEGTSGNQVHGNYIGLDVTGAITLSNGWDGVVIANGAQANVVGGAGLARNVISGNTYHGIVIEDEGTSGNQVRGNYIGTDATGTSPVRNGHDGIAIRHRATNNYVGGETAATGNLISGNGHFGVYIENEGTNNNQVRSNYIGSDATGTSALGNLWDGIAIVNGAQDNVVGGDINGARNIISGNNHHGILIAGEGTNRNQVRGNYIGINITGVITLSNGWDGIVIQNGAQANVVGGAGLAGNVISGNNHGIIIKHKGTIGNQVHGNYIGANYTGRGALGNKWAGIIIEDGAQNNMVGNGTEGARNVISGNGHEGIVIKRQGTTDNQVLGNYIGVDVTGTSVLSNGWDGVMIEDGAQDNVVGGNTEQARNVISGNHHSGVVIKDEGTNDNQVLGNYIGLDVTGTSRLGNNWYGIYISDGAKDNHIGGETENVRNVISANGIVGVFIEDEGTTGNQVRGNYIGTDPLGSQALGNDSGVMIRVKASHNTIAGNLISGNKGTGSVGVAIIEEAFNNQVSANYIGTDASGQTAIANEQAGVVIDNAINNVIGSDVAGVGNLISGNGEGIVISSGATSNQILGNYIGTDATGMRVLSESLQQNGVRVSTNALPSMRFNEMSRLKGPQNNIIGTDNIRNIISGHIGYGILIDGAEVTGNQVRGNYIGTDVSGSESLGNALGGVLISGAASQNLIGGQKSDHGNLISGNDQAGVQLQGSGTTDNQIAGNYIGTNADGTEALPNLSHGVYLVDGASSNRIEANNTIAYNGVSGVVLEGEGTVSNIVKHNIIQHHNQYGVHLLDRTSSNMIGISNTIAYNGLVGVAIEGETLANTITRNTIHQNDGPSIDIISQPIPPGFPSPPILAKYASEGGVLLGSACVGCQVEIFANPNNEPAGTLFLGEVTANSTGAFSMTLDISAALPYLSATVTDLKGTTSAFSASLSTIPIITPTATSTATPTATPTSTPTAVGTQPNHLYLPLVLR